MIKLFGFFAVIIGVIAFTWWYEDTEDERANKKTIDRIARQDRRRPTQRYTNVPMRQRRQHYVECPMRKGAGKWK